MSGIVQFEPEIWDCDTIVITCAVSESAPEEVLFRGRGKIEFTPYDPQGDLGFAEAVDFTIDGERPQILVQYRVYVAIIPPPCVYSCRRDGRTLLGTDSNGRNVAWYLGRDADEFLVQGEQPGLVVSEEEE